jgi:hypothetical protein
MLKCQRVIASCIVFEYNTFYRISFFVQYKGSVMSLVSEKKKNLETCTLPFEPQKRAVFTALCSY